MRRITGQPILWSYISHSLHCIYYHASHPAFYDKLGLPREFPQAQALRVLHLWMVVLRMHADQYDNRDLARMFEEFWAYTEHELIKVEGMSVLILSRTMAEIQSQSFGALAAYDVTLSVHRTQQDDSPLCGALYRNLYGTSRKTLDIPRHRLVQLKNYVLSNIAHLASLPAEDFYKGRITFIAPTFGEPTASEISESETFDLLWHETPIFNRTPTRGIGYDFKPEPDFKTKPAPPTKPPKSTPSSSSTPPAAPSNS